MKSNLELSETSLLSTKLKILLLLHSFGALDGTEITKKYKENYKVTLKKGSLHGTLSRLRFDGLIKSKVEIKIDERGNEAPIQLYKETNKGFLEIGKVVRDVENTTNLQMLPT